MDWDRNLHQAEIAAAKDGVPIMAILYRLSNLNDQKAVEKIASWPQVIQLSKGAMAAVRVNMDQDRNLEFLGKTKPPALPAIVWLDQHGNVILGQPMPQTADPIVQTVAAWKSTLGNIDRALKDHNGRGEQYASKGRLRDAYQEFGYAAPFKGPEPERAKKGQKQVRDRWGQLVKTAAAQPADARSRHAIVRGLRKETEGLDCAATIEEAIRSAGVPPTPEAAKKDAVALAGQTKTPAASVIEERPMTEALAVRVAPSEPPPEEAGVDLRFLSGNRSEQLKEAAKLMQDGIADMKKATGDGMDRGEERNKLLRAAHARFEKVLAALEEACATQPDPQIEKLMESAAMLMYGCMKYQSL
jgi:hypothetical protein